MNTYTYSFRISPMSLWVSWVLSAVSHDVVSVVGALSRCWGLVAALDTVSAADPLSADGPGVAVLMIVAAFPPKYDIYQM